MVKKMDTTIGNTAGAIPAASENQSTAGRLKPAPAQSELGSISKITPKETLALMQEDCRLYLKAGGEIAIFPKNGILAIVIQPPPGSQLGFDADTGHILLDGKPVTYEE